MGHIVGSKADGKIEQGGHSQTHSPLLLMELDIGQGGQDTDHIDVAEKRDEKRDAEEDHKEFQPERKDDLQLGLGEIIITDELLGNAGQGIVIVLDDEDHAEMGVCDQPEEETGGNSVGRTPKQLVFHRIGDV